MKRQAEDWTYWGKKGMEPRTCHRAEKENTHYVNTAQQLLIYKLPAPSAVRYALPVS